MTGFMVLPLEQVVGLWQLDITGAGADQPACAESPTDLVVKLAGGWDPFETLR